MVETGKEPQCRSFDDSILRQSFKLRLTWNSQPTEYHMNQNQSQRLKISHPPLSLQHPILKLIPPPPLIPQSLPPLPLEPKPQSLIQFLSPWIPLKAKKLNAMKARDLKPPFEYPLQRFRTITLTLIRRDDVYADGCFAMMFLATRRIQVDLADRSWIFCWRYIIGLVLRW